MSPDRNQERNWIFLRTKWKSKHSIPKSMGNNKGGYERQVYITLSANFKELEKNLLSVT